MTIKITTNMKWWTKILLMVMPLLIAACSDSDGGSDITNPDKDLVPIAMSSDISTSKQRAVYDDGDDPSGNTDDLKITGFAVYGWKNVLDTYTQVFTNTLVKGADGSTTGWDYSPLRYWDRAAKRYDFVAYAPQGNNVSPTAPTSSTPAKLSFTNIPQWQNITTDANKETAKDYIVAQNGNTTDNYLSVSNNGVVHFDFFHLLARLNIKAYCGANTSDARTKFILTKIVLSSKGKDSDGNDAEAKVPATSVTRTCDYTSKEAAPVNETIPSYLSFDSEDPEWTWESKTGEITLFDKSADYNTSDAFIPTYDKTAPNNVCNWLVAPFDLTSGFGYKASDNSSYFGPNFTLKVTYYARTEDSSVSEGYRYSVPHTTEVDLTFEDATDGNKVKPLFNSFVSHGDYTLTLNIEKGGVVVVLDVAITPWVSATTGADPRDVYNW